MKVVKKPWGEFKEFVKNKKCTVKVIEVKKGQAISLQYHKNRSETWYFLSNGFVQIEDKRLKVKAGDSLEIKKGQLHRAFATKKDFIFLEVATGDFSESDIVRIEDKYGRSKNEKKRL
jgi:mannose-6-phosphate isomerase-like protein (cupin superfamily)